MPTSDAETGDAYRFEFTAIDGGALPLSAWTGHPVLLVNTASECGFTPQYRDLEALWLERKEKGLVVLGVPSNDFGAQEPGSEAEIKDFCERNFAVTFPMTAKQTVVGGGAIRSIAGSRPSWAKAPRRNGTSTNT